MELFPKQLLKLSWYTFCYVNGEREAEKLVKACYGNSCEVRYEQIA